MINQQYIKGEIESNYYKVMTNVHRKVQSLVAGLSMMLEMMLYI